MAARFVLNSPPSDFFDFFSQTTLPDMFQEGRGGMGRQQQFWHGAGYSKDILGQSLPAAAGGEGFFDHHIEEGEVNVNEASGGLFGLQPVTTPLQRDRCDFMLPPQTEDKRLPFTYNDSATDAVINIGLRPISEIPQRYQSVFSSFSHFNLIQSKVFDDVMYTDSHLVTSAPTGSGKTVIFELAIIRVLMQMTESFNSLKIVYVAPIKALCSERYEDWSSKFRGFGLRCAELTGDSQLDDYFELQNAQIIMTTPEKWDSMTRKWRDNKSLVQLVQLFLLDEVHQLNDESRGPTLEAIVSRMKTVRSSVASDRGGGRGGGGRLLRFIAISATLPNIDDIASWLGTEEQPAIMHSIDDSHRPVKLRRIVLGFPDATTEFKFDLSLNYKISGIIHCYSDQKPTLVFCATRKGTQQAASVLVKDARFVMNVEHKRRLNSIASSINDTKLRELISFGVGYHHAGMSSNDRKLVETIFTNGELPVLFATSTLAMGVNLPAHLVIIKSTLHYIGGMFTEYTESQILQMIGRAGRPQFDRTATAVILTRNSTKSKYEALLGGSQLIESNLHSHLIEHLNAEIVLCTITDVSIALDWLKSTFLYIRIKKNPKHYSIPENLSPEVLEEKLQEMCLKDLHMLQDCGLVNMDDGFTLVPTDTGRLMARYYVAFESMKRFLGLRGNEALGELVEELSKCKEFQDVRLRMNEKRILNQLNKDKHRLTIRFPINGKIKSTDMKVNCLLQATLGCIPVTEFSLNQDTQKIFRSASRLCRCLMELVLLGNNYTALMNGVLLHKCIQARLWEDSKYVVKQLDKIGLALSTNLVNAGVTSFAKLLEKNPRELELIVNRHPPFGNQVREAASKLSHYSVNIEQMQSPPLDCNGVELLVSVLLVNHQTLREAGSTSGLNHTCLLIIGNENNDILLKQKITDSQLISTGSWSKRIMVTQSRKGPKIKISCISMEYVGIDIHKEFTPTYAGVLFNTLPQHGIDTQQSLQDTRSCSETKPKGKIGTKGRRKLCSHRCINKAVCGHDCCKYGILTENENTPLQMTTTPVKRKQKRGGGEMAVHINDLRNRMSSIPPTPGVKRMKVMNSGYRDYLSPKDMRKDFCYIPKSKLAASLPPPSLPSSVSLSLSSTPVHDEEGEREKENLEEDDTSFYDPDLFTMYDNLSDDDFSPPPLPPPLPTLPPCNTQDQSHPTLSSLQPMLPPWQPLSPPWQPEMTPSKSIENLKDNKKKCDEASTRKHCQRNILSDLNNVDITMNHKTLPPPSSSTSSFNILPFFSSSRSKSNKQTTPVDDDDVFGEVFDDLF